MATVAAPPPTDQAADLLQKLSLDAQAKPVEIPEPTKKPSAIQYGSIDSGNAAIGQIPNERSVTPFSQDFMDHTMCYVPNAYQSYYYGGAGGDYDYSSYTNSDGVDMASGVYGDNGSLMYHPSYGYGHYGPYSPAASPVPSMGNDGQLYGPQHYQYPPYFQPLTPTSGLYTPSSTVPPSQGDISTSAAAEQKPISVENAIPNNGNSLTNGGVTKGNNGAAPIKSAYQNSSFGSNAYARGTLPGQIPSAGYQDPRYGFDGLRSSFPWADGYSDGQSRPFSSSTITPSITNANNIPSSRNPSFRPGSHYVGYSHPTPMSGMNTTQGYMNRMYPGKLYGQFGNTVRSRVGYASHGYDTRSNGRMWLAVDNKYKPRGRNGGYYGYGNENMDGLNELNRGPRAKGGNKTQKGFVPTVLTVKGQLLPTNAVDEEENDKPTTPDMDLYNKADFPEEYADAKFFVIKSYSEDDVHKSIKYNVWASTPNGNKKLDAAYQEAQEKAGGCPIFLFFSVNTSGQFVGLAEMVGPVDFQKNLEYWQQDKWNGCFPVKWHVVKDVPNSLLKHIILENNENKPVTNSRDTQEIRLEPGHKMVKIFKEHASKTCILDDFSFYETRQKTIQEKKAKQQQFKKQVWEGKPTEEKKEVSEVVVDMMTPPIPVEALNDLVKEQTTKISENGSVLKTGDAATGAKLVSTPPSEKISVVANGH